jgi:8-oxo-dGTP pyrophosphatase MutT (NUDIX family)
MRRRRRSACAPRCSTRSRRRAIEVAGSQDAAVLAPLFERDGELHAVFTRRRGDLRIHAGQVSFPGGRREPGDADLVATALREAHEEIGLDPAAVTVLGALHPTPTVVSDIAIYPVVGLIAARASPLELAAARGGRHWRPGRSRRGLRRRGTRARVPSA